MIQLSLTLPITPTDTIDSLLERNHLLGEAIQNESSYYPVRDWYHEVRSVWIDEDHVEDHDSGWRVHALKTAIGVRKGTLAFISYVVDLDSIHADTSEPWQEPEKYPLSPGYSPYSILRDIIVPEDWLKGWQDYFQWVIDYQKDPLGAFILWENVSELVALAEHHKQNLSIAKCPPA